MIRKSTLRLSNAPKERGIKHEAEICCNSAHKGPKGLEECLTNMLA